MSVKLRVFAWQCHGIGEAYLETEGIEDAATVRAVAALLAATLGVGVQNGLSAELRAKVARVIERGEAGLEKAGEKS